MVKGTCGDTRCLETHDKNVFLCGKKESANSEYRYYTCSSEGKETEDVKKMRISNVDYILIDNKLMKIN